MSEMLLVCPSFSRGGEACSGVLRGVLAHADCRKAAVRALVSWREGEGEEGET